MTVFLIETILAPIAKADPPSVDSSPSTSPTSTPSGTYGGTVTEDPNALLNFKKKDGADVDTIRMIDAQNKTLESGNNDNFSLQNSITTGQARAQEMVNALKSEELQKVLPRVTAKGKDMLQENPELKTPMAVIAGSISLWAGNTLKLIQNDTIKVTSYIEGKSRSGDFKMDSPLVNGKLQFNETDGLQLNMNRSISSIQSNAAVVYNVKTQSLGGELSHHLLPHLDLSIGSTQVPQTSQMDQQAKISYHLNF